MTDHPGTCYLLCIQPPYHHARHYARWTADADPTRRIGEHLAGRFEPDADGALRYIGTGSPLVAAAPAAASTWCSPSLATAASNAPGTTATARGSARAVAASARRSRGSCISRSEPTGRADHLGSPPARSGGFVMQPESLSSLYSCQAAFLGTCTRCGRPAISILRADGATADSATMRAYCADHDAQALTAARWTHAVLDLVDKPCTACHPDQGCRGREYQAHSCPCHHWDRKPLVDGFCSDPTCSCSEGVYPLGVRS